MPYKEILFPELNSGLLFVFLRKITSHRCDMLIFRRGWVDMFHDFYEPSVVLANFESVCNSYIN